MRSNWWICGAWKFESKKATFGRTVGLGGGAAGRIVGNTGEVVEGLKLKVTWLPGIAVLVRALQIVELWTICYGRQPPPRSTVCPSPLTFHANPTRGPKLFMSLGIFPVCGIAGLTRLLNGVGSASYSQRRPSDRLKRFRIFQSSPTKA